MCISSMSSRRALRRTEPVKSPPSPQRRQGRPCWRCGLVRNLHFDFSCPRVSLEAVPVEIRTETRGLILIRSTGMQIALLSDEPEMARVECVGSMTMEHFLSGGDVLANVLGGTECYKRAVLLNLEKTDFIDSSGIGWLIKWHQRF